MPAATALVVANMIGTGVFVSLGFQLLDFHSAPPILLLWALGGLVALCGALCYAELARCLPRSGGEYYFLGTIYHPAVGFMAGMLSAITGFAAPTAITALGIGAYFHEALPGLPKQAIAIGVILLGTAAHGLSARTSGRVQVVATTLKLALIATFLVATIFHPGQGDIRWGFVAAEDGPQILSAAFAGAALHVFYAYSGWNAAVYGLEEWDQPGRTVRRALLGGTALVTLLYLGLNMAFLKAAPVAELRGVPAVGHVAARALFGEGAGRLISGLFAVGLFASVSALLWAGPRVLGAMSRDVPALRFLAPRREVPLRALLFQSGLAILLVSLGKIDWLIDYTQTGLTLCTFLSVLGLLLLARRRRRQTVEAGAPLSAQAPLPSPAPVPSGRVWLPAAVFLAVTGYVLAWQFAHGAGPATIGLATAVFCAILWFPLSRLFR